MSLRFLGLAPLVVLAGLGRDTAAPFAWHLADRAPRQSPGTWRTALA